ncbi:hypothetical protein ACTVJH_11015 [Desulfoplanes sp. PS50]
MIAYLSFSQAALTALVLFLFAGFWGCPIIALVCEIAGRMSKRIFLDKLALQMTRLGSLIHIGTWLGLIAGVAALWYRQPESIALIRPSAWLLLPTLGLGLVGTGLFIIYFATWNLLKKEKKKIHMILGLAGFMLLKPLFWIPVLIIRSKVLGTNLEFQSLFPPLNSLFWPVGIQWAFTSLSMAAVLGSLYLLIRRNRDDFGRDYYKFALPVCAKWALFPFIAVLATCAWIAALTYSAVNIQQATPLMAATAIRGGSLLLCVIIWVVIMKTATPLRFKGMIVASGLFAWTFLIGTLAALWEMLGPYTGVYTPHSFAGSLLTWLGLS